MNDTATLKGSPYVNGLKGSPGVDERRHPKSAHERHDCVFSTKSTKRTKKSRYSFSRFSWFHVFVSFVVRVLVVRHRRIPYAAETPEYRNIWENP